MPTKIFIGPDWQLSAGISIEWTPTAQRLDISGWYDGMVGIEGESITLGEFFTRLNITEAHCRKAFCEKKEKKHD
jgi:hypothetical protein